ncbi:hypothetical protein FB567DRAFT_533373 [Paraphoma chrysanthemicola]|uniref:Uncharacterized protein n=1 Tax=Paraphoma chrysanthemicola TaxID=798071 RepID=A0A8K0R0E6_9PLEO|nr:hypothetical protein FB567DRAFT_533373 [Paraphoma chrysanthemicola]
MAVSLTAWLEETFATQLLLGNHWLQSKNEQKHTGARSEPERAWTGLYHDNGSCLDITNDLHPERNSSLQIVQLSPLVLSDGQTKVHPHIAPECLSLFPPELPLHAVFAVRRYTIRYSSYGPPQDALRFILHAVDWLGDAPRAPHRSELKELCTDEIEHILRQLRHTRAREDRRCLNPDSSTQESTYQYSAIMSGLDENESQPQTQFALGTQVVHPVRPRPQQDEPRVLGVRRLEPVLAGNTQREDIRPRGGNQNARLLELLKSTNLPSTQTVNSIMAGNMPRAVATKPPGAAPSLDSELRTQLPTVATRQPTQTQKGGHTQEEKSHSLPTSPGPARTMKRARDTNLDSPKARHSTAESSTAAVTTEETHGDKLERLASECAWMKDFEFSHDSLRVPYEQVSILLKDESWHKPLIGRQFPPGNMPVQTLIMLTRLADEKAAMEARPDSDDDMDEDPSPEDPSPQNPSPEAPSPEPILEQTQDELTSTQASWSPTPEPPQMPSRPDQGLPPDSSFEMREANVGPTARKMTLISSPPRPAVVDLAQEKGQSPPPSTPPDRPDYDIGLAAYEDDMEMEEFVPQGLGEDSVDGASKAQTRPAFSPSPLPRSTVQVKETPDVKSKSGRPPISATSPQPPRHNSSGTSKTHSSTSVVHATYRDNRRLISVADEPYAKVSVAPAANEDNEIDLLYRGPARSSPSPTPIESGLVMPKGNTQAPAVPAITPTLQSEQVEAQTHTSKHPIVEHDTVHSSWLSSLATLPPPKSTTSILNIPASPDTANQSDGRALLKDVGLLKSPSLPPGATKRKLENSPSKRSSRQPKRRELKIVSFGDASPSTSNATSALRRDREEALRKFRENRQSSTSLESHVDSAATSVSVEDGDAMQVDSANAHMSNDSRASMSPRHTSLYDPPSPPKEVQPTTTTTPATVLASPQAQSVSDEPASTKQSLPSHNLQALSTDIETPDVFEVFKKAYPEYTGDVKHFKNLCTQMIELDQDDKMVPKWQWDDYIVRNRTDYMTYARDCIERGEDAMPYNRFYKDMVRDTLFQKGIVDGRATLLRALDQFGVQPPAPRNAPPQMHDHTERVPSVSRKEKRGRTSLPSAFNKSQATERRLANSTHDRPRHSLPAGSQVHQQPSLKNIDNLKVRTPVPSSARQAHKDSRSTKKPNALSRLMLDGASSPRKPGQGDATESTSDPFRDFVFAYKRLTSLTGSTKVDARLPWPKSLAVRPSVADVPKKKHDVLKWTDEL